MRGMGDFFGARQHGLPEFRFYRAELDDDLLEAARSRARAIVAADPGLTQPDNARLRTLLHQRFAERARLFDIG
jgi:ATP-dependent DNA helicase RecG